MSEYYTQDEELTQEEIETLRGITEIDVRQTTTSCVEESAHPKIIVDKINPVVLKSNSNF
jgi:hypothetical protein